MILFKQQVKLKRRSKQNTYHVTNENITPSEVTDNVGDERGDAFRGIPKLRVFPLLILLILISHPKLENFNHTKLNGTS